MTAPTSRSRQRTRRAVASRKPSQNTPTFSTSEISTAPTVAPTPVSRCPAPPARPDRNVVDDQADADGEHSAKRPDLRHGEAGPARRCGIRPDLAQRILHRVGDAPAPNSRRKAMPMTRGSAGTRERPQLDLDLGPITGYWDRAESSSVCCSAGLPLSIDVQHRGQHQQQREERDEAVVGDESGEVPCLVVAELLPDRDREGQPRLPLLEPSAAATGSAQPRAPVRSIAFICPVYPVRGALIRLANRLKRESRPASGSAHEVGRGRASCGQAAMTTTSLSPERRRCRRGRTGRRSNAARAATTTSR